MRHNFHTTILRAVLAVAAAAAACASVSSCSLYRKWDGKTSTDTAKELFTQAPDVDGDLDTAADAAASLPSWREFFTDPVLCAYIDSALSRNTSLATAQLRVEEAEAQLKAAQLALLPGFDLSPKLNVSTGNISSGWGITLSSSWEIDLFARNTNARRGQEAALEQSRAYEQAVRTALVADVAATYYTLRMLQEQLDVTERTARTWEENLRTQEALKRTGRATQLAVAQARASKANTEASAVSLRQQIESAQRAMGTLLLDPYFKMPAPSGDIPWSCDLPAGYDGGIPIAVLRNLPSVRRSEQSLVQSYYATLQARAAMYPSITLAGSAGYASGGATISSPADLVASAALSALQPIFHQGQLRANYKVAQARQAEALEAFKEALLSAANSANDALSQHQAASQRLGLDSERVEALQEALSGAELLMKHSSASYLDVLLARQSLLSAELSLLSDKYSLVQSKISLYHALGGGAQ